MKADGGRDQADGPGERGKVSCSEKYLGGKLTALRENWIKGVRESKEEWMISKCLSCSSIHTASQIIKPANMAEREDQVCRVAGALSCSMLAK